MIRQIALCLVVLCVARSYADEPATPPLISADVKAVAKSNNDFAVDLYSKLRTRQTGNISISPFSLFTALTMTSAGARDGTARETQSALHLRSIAKTAHDSLAELRRRLQEAEHNGNCQLKIANQLWGRSGFACLPDFQRTLQKNYGAELVQLDFSQPATASRTINNWVNENTNGKIPDLISPQALGDDAQLVLANAIYFKAKWEAEFRKESTRQEPFHLSAKTKSKCRSCTKPTISSLVQSTRLPTTSCGFCDCPTKGMNSR
jgi:serine protease inhibitor